MQDNPSIARVLSDSAEWLMALPRPTHAHLAAAGTLLIEAAHVMQGEMALAEAVMAAPNARQGNWRPRPASQADAIYLPDDAGRPCDHAEHYAWTHCPARVADVSRETSAPTCDADWGSATASQCCVLPPRHLGLHMDGTGHEFDSERSNATAEVHH